MTSRTIRKLSSSSSVTSSYFLKTCIIRDIVYEKEMKSGLKGIVAVKDDKTVFEAIDKMNENNVNTIAVYRLNENDKKVYIAVVTTLDILNWFTWKNRKSETKKILISNLAGITDESKSIWAFTENQHLDSVIQPFMQGVHSLIVQLRKNPLRKIMISQFDVIWFFYKNLGIISESKEFFSSSLEKSKILERMSKAITIDENKPVKKGFEIMTKKSIRGIAVVNSEGKFISNLESKHAKCFLNSQIELQFETETVKSFLQQVEKPGGCDGCQNVVTKSTRVAEVVAKMAENHFHRVWLVDIEMKPLLVITLSDLIKEIALQDFYKEFEEEISS